MIMVEQPLRRPAQDVVGEEQGLDGSQPIARVGAELRHARVGRLPAVKRAGRHVGKARVIAAAQRQLPSSKSTPACASTAESSGPSAARRMYPVRSGGWRTGYDRKMRSDRPRSGRTEHLRGFSLGCRTITVGG